MFQIILLILHSLPKLPICDQKLFSILIWKNQAVSDRVIKKVVLSILSNSPRKMDDFFSKFVHLCGLSVFVSFYLKHLTTHNQIRPNYIHFWNLNCTLFAFAESCVCWIGVCGIWFAESPFVESLFAEQLPHQRRMVQSIQNKTNQIVVVGELVGEVVGKAVVEAAVLVLRT